MAGRAGRGGSARLWDPGPWTRRAGVVALTSQAVSRQVKPAPEGWHPLPVPPARAWDAGGCCTASLWTRPGP